jgi:hypothetical protein
MDGGPEKTPRARRQKVKQKRKTASWLKRVRGSFTHREDYRYIFGTALHTLLDPIFRRPTSGHSRPRPFLGGLYIAICDALYDANDTERLGHADERRSTNIEVAENTEACNLMKMIVH